MNLNQDLSKKIKIDCKENFRSIILKQRTIEFKLNNKQNKIKRKETELLLFKRTKIKQECIKEQSIT